MTGLELVFAAFGALAVAAGLLAVTSKQVVHAALWLVVALGALAGVYLTLGAEVVALVQLLVYVGAVVVLVLFALMLTRAPIGVRTDLDGGPGRVALAALAGLAVGGLLAGTLLVAVGDATVTPDLERGGAGPLGAAIFGAWLLPFELLSVLLLAALVAAIAISRGTGAARPRANGVRTLPTSRPPAGTTDTTGASGATDGAGAAGAAGTAAAPPDTPADTPAAPVAVTTPDDAGTPS